MTEHDYRPMIKVQYHEFNDTPATRQLQGIIEELLPLLPAWVQTVNVFLVEDGDGHLAITPKIDYRMISLFISEPFLAWDMQLQRRELVHEVAHTYIADLTVWVQTRLLPPVQKKNEELYDVLNQEFTERMERTTELLTAVMLGWVSESPRLGVIYPELDDDE